MKTYTFASGWNHTLGAAMLNELRFGYDKANSQAVQDPFGQAGIAIPGVPNDPRIAGGLAGINFSTGNYRLGSPDFLPKYQHTQQFQVTDTLSWFREEPVEIRRRPDDADEEHVPRRAGDARIGDVPSDVHGQRARRLPARIRRRTRSSRTSPRTHQELSGYAFYAQDDWKPVGQAHGERRPALRLHDAAARSRQSHLQLRSDRRRRLLSGVQAARWRTARW